jgi:hypothetical protein
MYFRWLTGAACSLFFFFLLPSLLMAQPGASVQLNKPKKFENRSLASEKTSEKKLGAFKRFNQNLNTHYNFAFNANNKLNDILENAKRGFKEDYSRLLPFYNYSLDNTITQKDDLDSVLQKCNAGILLHDLRNDWIDNLYLMMGRAYFYKKDFDSAGIAFQYVNYAFQPRSKDEIGYDKSIGSNLNAEGNVFTVATKEKKGIVQKITSTPPSRNDALIWLTRTLIERGDFADAWSIIETLRRDKNFPARLAASLQEMQAYWYYSNRQYDSVAQHLEKALGNAGTAQERARWEFLIAQLYGQAGKKDEANKFYDRSILHTIDPILEVYARLNKLVLEQGENDEDLIEKNINELLKMSRRDKYENYRHYIFYTAAQMELQRKDTAAALGFLKRSLEFNSTDPSFKNKTFLQSGELALATRQYDLAFSSYDSIDINDPIIINPEEIKRLRELLSQINEKRINIKVEDSLVKIASMPAEEREDYVKRLARKLRKEKGLKEEPAAGTTNNILNNNAEAVDIFLPNDSKGEWYFYNASRKSKGFSEFRSQWGNRPNVDNWRRLADVSAQLNIAAGKGDNTTKESNAASAVNSKINPVDISYEALMKNLPLTPEARKVSDDTLQNAFFALGKIFKDKLEDYPQAIENYEQLLNRYPNTIYQEEALFDLYYCYTKLGNRSKANFYKGFLSSNFRQSRLLKYIDNPLAAQQEQNAFKEAATKQYEKIYSLFIEGKFEEALASKQKADSTYGENFWTPQLLYIESVYYIKQKQDSAAISTLQKITALYPNSPLTAKATNLVDVVSRRNEIEEYLSKLEIQRAKEDSIVITEEPPKPKEKETIVQEIKTKPQEPPAKLAPVTAKVDTTQFKRPNIETVKAGFGFKPADQHLVALVLDKVDVVYVNEARNAINRYNKEKYYNQPLEMSLLNLDDVKKLVLVSFFTDAVAAMDYVERTRKIAQMEIFPWLAADKYSFIIISAANLELLKTNKDMGAYRKFLTESYPGKF